MRKGAILASMVGIGRVHGQSITNRSFDPMFAKDRAANNLDGPPAGYGRYALGNRLLTRGSIAKRQRIH